MLRKRSSPNRTHFKMKDEVDKLVVKLNKIMTVAFQFSTPRLCITILPKNNTSHKMLYLGQVKQRLRGNGVSTDLQT